ncbi:saccharopine dehydrogenase NADP-binding domain-containing protein [Desulfococcaceae bacterium HSG9]|nr:saccharopine dehydrogenase NADP-binding domain-containing protein [Desulfococcaceae bacterium HSG9]
MKKVFIIGAGAQGNVISGVLSQADDVDAILLGDVDLGRAEEVARFVGSDKITAVHVDASDVDKMADMITQGPYELVVNACLPVFDRPIMEACLKGKADYLDMASNEMLKSSTKETVQDEFLVEQLEYAKEFEEAGLKALILAGGDSGLVNILAREAVDELDEIDYIGIKDYGIVDCDEPVGLWSLPVYMQDCADEAVYWEDGQHKHAPIFSGEEEYYFPPPLDCHGKVYYHTHEEPVTIPKFIGKPVKYCDFKLGEPGVDMWRFLIEGLGMMGTEPIEVNGMQVIPRDVFFKMLPPTLTPEKCVEMVKDKKIMSRLQLAVDVKGRKGGEYRHYKMWTESPNIVQACGKIPGTNDVSWITSVPASILSLMLLRDQIKPVGVFPCEVLDKEERDIFFAGVKSWDVKIHTQITSEI